jgi:hypothetical protein
MKELVCIAPDGSLEIWMDGSLGVSSVWEVAIDMELEPCSPIFRLKCTFCNRNPPEFWGREILGDL